MVFGQGNEAFISCTLGLQCFEIHTAENAADYGGLHQKSRTALVPALSLISEGGPGPKTLELSSGSAKVDLFWV